MNVGFVSMNPTKRGYAPAQMGQVRSNSAVFADN